MLARLPQLNQLTLCTDAMAVWRPLAECNVLTSLVIECSSTPPLLMVLSQLAAAPSLLSLHLSCDSGACRILAFASCTRLIALSFTHCRALAAGLEALTALTRLTSLRFVDCDDVCSIEFLSACLSLQSLQLLGRSDVTDFGPLAACVRLKHLALQHCWVTEVRALACCTDLLSLDLTGTSVADVGPLAACLLLRTLTLRSCRSLESVTPLEACASLSDLDISHTQVDDMRPMLSTNPGPWTLAALSCTDVDTASVTAACRQLTRLKWGGWFPGDIPHPGDILHLAPLVACDKLASLSVHCCAAHIDLPLAALRGLAHLAIPSCEMADVVPGVAASCAQLQSLDLGGSTSLTTLDGLQQLRRLQALHLGDCTSLPDFAPVAELTGLTALTLRSCQLSSGIGFVGRLARLEMLDVSDCPDFVTDIRPVSGCRQLTSLKITNCRACDLSALASCPRLRELLFNKYWSAPPVLDISPLQSCRDLRRLDLGRHPLRSVCAALERLDQLKILMLCDCEVDDLEGVCKSLSRCRRLRNVNLQGTGVTVGQARAAIPWLSWATEVRAGRLGHLL